MKPRSDYDCRVSDGVIVVTDRNLGATSVTNDAEAVIADLVAEGYDLTAMPVIYRDSDDHLWRLFVQNNEFDGFGWLHDSNEQEAVRLTLAAHNQVQRILAPEPAPA